MHYTHRFWIIVVSLTNDLEERAIYMGSLVLCRHLEAHNYLFLVLFRLTDNFVCLLALEFFIVICSARD